MYELNGVVYAGSPAPIIKVIEVQCLPDFMLQLVFNDGRNKTFDCKPILCEPAFQPLADPAVFDTAHIEYGTVVWNNDIDIAPEYLYYQD